MKELLESTERAVELPPVNTWTVTRTPAGMAIERVNRKCLLGLRGHPSTPALCEEGLHKASGAGYQCV